MSRTGLLIPVLALLALFFGWRTYEAWTGPVAGAGVAVRPGAPADPIGLSPVQEPPPAELSADVAYIVARPVFRPDRRPYAEEAGAAPARRNYEAELSRFTLLGVLLLGKDKKGVVEGKGGTGREERWEVSPGDSLPGFRVKDVGADGLTLVADDKEFLLPLYAGGPKSLPGGLPVRTDVGPPRETSPARQPSAPTSAGAVSGGAAQTAPRPGVAPREPTDSSRDRRPRPVYIPGRR